MFSSKSIQGIIILILGLFLSIWLGLSITTNQSETIFQITAAATAIFCLYLGTRVWLLIPLMTALEITLRVPGNPTTQLLGQLLALTFSLLLFLMHKLRVRLTLTKLDIWIFVFALLILEVYIRNPVGLNVFGGASVGGRPYVLFLMCIITALLLSGLRITIKDLDSIVKWTILGGLMNLAVNFLGAFVPTIAFYTGGSYANTGETNYENFGVAVDTEQANRITWLPAISRNIALWITTFISPVKALVKPYLMVLIIASFVCATFSGFRTAVMTITLTYIFGIAYRSGFTSLIISGFIGSAAIAFLALGNVVHPFPPNIQRALSFLPGTWNQRYIKDADGSTEWRVEIWKEALLTDRWISNKWLGDGLGYSARELAYQMNSTKRKGPSIGMSGLDQHREAIMSNGDYHSTLVSGVRTAGYFGTFLLIISTFHLAFDAHRLIVRHRHTRHYPLCLMIGLPTVIAPIWLFIGSANFTQSLSALVLGIGMVRLLQNNLPIAQSEQHLTTTTQPMTIHSRPHPSPSTKFVR